MQKLRKISSKLVTLSVALTTTMVLLSPYDANATSGTSTGGGGAEKCGWEQKSQQCGKKYYANPATGTTGYILLYDKDCPKGNARTCEYRGDCSGARRVIVSCNPDCSIRFN